MQMNAPRARRDLIVKELDNETLIFDSQKNKAFCLNGSAAVIWRMCDGTTPVAAMTERAAKVAGLPAADDSFVRFALEGFHRDGLLESGYVAASDGPVVSRARMMSLAKNAGIVALAVPLITAIMAPSAAQAYGRKHHHGDGDGNDGD